MDAQAGLDATVYTDGSSAYRGRENHESIAHSAGEYVPVPHGPHQRRGELLEHVEAGPQGSAFHRLSPKHLQRYVDEFAGRHHIRDRDTIDQMNAIVAGLVGKRLMYRDLIRPTGRSAVAG